MVVLIIGLLVVLSLITQSNFDDGLVLAMSFFSTTGADTNVAIGTSGKLHRCVYEDTQTMSGNIAIGQWIKIEEKGKSTALPDVSLGRHIRVAKTIALATGDKVRKFTPVLCGTVRDVSVPKSKEKQDIGTQADTSSNYAVSDIVDREGNISGVFMASDELFMAVEAEFDDTVVIKADGTASETEISSSIFHCLLSRDEKGNPEVWEYLPIRVTKSDSTKTQKGDQAVSWDYFTVGSEKPHRIVMHKS